MPLVYKIDVLNALKEKGYNTNKIRTEGLLISLCNLSNSAFLVDKTAMSS